MAIYEIRYSRHKVSDEQPKAIANASDACAYLRRYCFKSDQMWRESAVAVFLNRSNKVIGHIMLSVGSQDECVLNNKLVAKAAINCLAHGVLLAHNHPSGNVLPSSNDIVVTTNLKKGLNIFDINLVDHIILEEERYYSFTEQGRL